jgi:hypothetical protein
MSEWFHFNRQPDSENTFSLVSMAGKPFTQAARTGKDIDNWYRHCS